ncbi:hypothetical protein T492DRAFT_884003 [Pavlovales sp. CCMP2436]|nr:hypothetical protein T492DRAFT_884003 [Pavlovales sp. CCMP2436]
MSHEASMSQALYGHRATARAARRRCWWWGRSLFTMTPLLVERGEATHLGRALVRRSIAVAQRRGAAGEQETETDDDLALSARARSEQHARSAAAHSAHHALSRDDEREDEEHQHAYVRPGYRSNLLVRPGDGCAPRRCPVRALVATGTAGQRAHVPPTAQDGIRMTARARFRAATSLHVEAFAYSSLAFLRSAPFRASGARARLGGARGVGCKRDGGPARSDASKAFKLGPVTMEAFTSRAVRE